MSSSEKREGHHSPWIVVVVATVALVSLVLRGTSGAYLSAWPAWGKILVLLGIPLVPAVIIALWGYAFAKNLGFLPRIAFAVAFLCYAGLVAVLWFQVPLDHEMSQWSRAGQLAFIFLIPCFLLALVPVYGYIYGDAKRRGMRYVMWTLLAIFVPDLIGVILYFILRDPLPAECPACHTVNLAKFAFCPHCGAAMKPVCPQCGKALEPSWINCGYCGAKAPAVASGPLESH